MSLKLLSGRLNSSKESKREDINTSIDSFSDFNSKPSYASDFNPFNPFANNNDIPAPLPKTQPVKEEDDDLGFDVDELVRKIDAKIAELEAEEKNNKDNKDTVIKGTGAKDTFQFTGLDVSSDINTDPKTETIEKVEEVNKEQSKEQDIKLDNDTEDDDFFDDFFDN